MTTAAGDPTASDKIEEAIVSIQAARKKLKRMQESIKFTDMWHVLESIDDDLHTALTALGT